MSINANELRIGNKIKGTATGLLITVDMHFFNECYDDETMLDWHQPIPLTEKWILDLQFSKSDGYYWKTWGENGVIIIKFDPYYDKFKIELGKGHYRILYHVHELQNGFYFLTLGQELIYNPK